MFLSELIIGLFACMSRLSLVLSFRFSGHLCGSSASHKNDLSGKGLAQSVAKGLQLVQGDFWKGFISCHQMSCGGCYSLNQNVLFHVKQRAIDEESNDPLHQ
jgi:hypothetical protein